MNCYLYIYACINWGNIIKKDDVKDLNIHFAVKIV